MQEDMKMLVAIFLLFINTVFGQQQSLKPCPQQTHMCFLDPCILATCPKYPLASCRNFKCGSTCIAEFWYNGEEVTTKCASSPGKDLLTSIFSSGSKPSGGTSNTVNGNTQPSTSSNGCPSGQDRVNCFRQPCSVSSCPGVPGATCRDNYCGGCKAEYFVGQQDVTSQCPLATGATAVTIPQVNNNPCPNGQQMSNCAVRPCAINSCPRFPAATCRDNYCGGCNAQFFLGQEEVTSRCTEQTAVPTGGPQMNPAGGPSQDPSTGNCPPNQVMRCNFSPCRVSSCVNYPNAICRDVNCGGCYAKFYYNGQEVTSLCRRQQQPQHRPFPPWYYFLFGDAF